MISTYVRLVANDHGIDNIGLPIRLAFQWEHHVTVFEADAWIGHGAIIRAGLTIGRGAVVGAGSVVTHNVEPYTVVGGSPACIIRKRFTDEEVTLHEKAVFARKVDD